MDTITLEVISGLTLAVCLWVLAMVYRLGLDVKGIKSDMKHVPTKREVDKLIAEHALLCAQHRARHGER